jgi:hypothetical protein
MANDVLDLMRSIATLMEEETAKMQSFVRFPEQNEIVDAKARLTGQLSSQIARLQREEPEWLEALDLDVRDALRHASQTLHEASLLNAQVLERKISLSTDLMGAIAAEAQRLTGRQSETYGASGGLASREDGAPIAINRQL